MNPKFLAAALVERRVRMGSQPFLFCFLSASSGAEAGEQEEKQRIER